MVETVRAVERYVWAVNVVMFRLLLLGAGADVMQIRGRFELR